MLTEKVYTIFDSYEFRKEERKLDRAIKNLERESYQLNLFDRNHNTDLKDAVKQHNWELIDRIGLKIYDPREIPAEKYIEILKKYARAFSLVRTPHDSVNIKMIIMDNVHRIWKDMLWVKEKLPEEIEKFGLVHDYPSDFLLKYEKIRNENPSSLNEEQGISLERTLGGTFEVYRDYFLDLIKRLEFLKRPNNVLKRYEKICGNKEKFGKVISSMDGSLKYVSYIRPNTLRWKIDILVEHALEQKPDFIDSIPKSLEDIVNIQINEIIKGKSKNFRDEVVYEVPLSYTDQDFLNTINELIHQGRLNKEKFWDWLFTKTGYKKSKKRKG